MRKYNYTLEIYKPQSKKYRPVYTGKLSQVYKRLNNTYRGQKYRIKEREVS